MIDERSILHGKMSDICPSFKTLDYQHKFIRLSCPISLIECKLVKQKLLGILFNRPGIAGAVLQTPLLSIN